MMPPVAQTIAVLEYEQHKQLERMMAIDRYKRFMPVAQSIAAMSKYAGTKVGAVALGPDLEIRSTGWNGAPRGSTADVDSRIESREERLFWAVHAEANAVANAARHGASLKDTTFVVTHTPCMSCAKLLVQAGVVRIVCPAPTGRFAERWQHEYDRARALFKECGVDLIEFEEDE